MGKKKRFSVLICLSGCMVLFLFLFSIRVVQKMEKEKDQERSSRQGMEEKTEDAVSAGEEGERTAEEEEARKRALKENEKERKVSESIRVLIRTDGYTGILHDKVVVSAKEDIILHYGKKTKICKKGKEISIFPGDSLFSKGEIDVNTSDEAGRLTLLSVKRSQGNPSYQGKLILKKKQGKILVINETGLEEYLYGVVNSEMPENYGMEALKAQAVCARTYAFRQMELGGLTEYGADLDDSTAYQVYQNMEENESATKAVDETCGEILSYKGETAQIFYFSTSCGHTSTAGEIWDNLGTYNYLEGKLQNREEKQKAEEQKAEEGIVTGELDLTEGQAFEDFIKENTGSKKDPLKCWDSYSPWYRWNVFMSREDVKYAVDTALFSCYQSNPEHIKTKLESGLYMGIPVDTVGTIKNIKIEKRGKGGIVTSILLIGSEQTVRVSTEYCIRRVLAPLYESTERADGSSVGNLSLLPSAFFYIQPEEENGKKGFHLYGGGYGHGTGLSQNGAQAMAEAGFSFEEILSHYFEGTELITIHS